MGTILAILAAMLVVTISALAYVKAREPDAPWLMVVLLLWAPFLVNAWVRKPSKGVEE